METATTKVNGETVTIRYMSFDKFCARFYKYIHVTSIATMHEDYETSCIICKRYKDMNAYYDPTYDNYSFYKTVLIYIVSQSPSISEMYDIYKANRLKGNKVIL